MAIPNLQRTPPGGTDGLTASRKEVLSDGTSVVIRPIHDHDVEL